MLWVVVLTKGCEAVAASPKLTKIQLELERSLNSDAISACVASTIERSVFDRKTPVGRVSRFGVRGLLIMSHECSGSVPIRRTARMLIIFLFDTFGAVSSLEGDVGGDNAASSASLDRGMA